MDINTLLAQAAEAEQYQDQTIDTGPSFDNEPPAAGKTPARFVGYVEMGVRPQNPYMGKEKPDCAEVRVFFELNGKKHRKEVEVDGVTKTFTNIISQKIAIKTGDKAGFAKLLKRMAYGRDIKHMAKMLGEGFLIDIIHNTVEASDGKPERTYANMKDDDGNWLIGAPELTALDDDGEPITKPVKVPELTAPIKLLLWSNPTQEQWDTLFIDGTRTVKDSKGVETEVSKNWMQEDIVANAKNYPGSALEGIVGGAADLDLGGATSVPEDAPKEQEKLPVEDDVIDVDDEKKAPVPAEEPKQKKDAPEAEPTASSDDVLDQLEL